MSVRKVIFPIAGLGTRFLPATKSQPKEMLPVVDKPAIQYLVEESIAAGIKDIIFVTGKGKTAIEDHFDSSPDLERVLIKKKKFELLELVKSTGGNANFMYVRQDEPLGDGHAIAKALPMIGDDEPVLVMFGDCIWDSEVPAAAQLIKTYEKYKNPVIGLARIPMEEVSNFGVISGRELSGDNIEIEKIVEKPSPDFAPSNLVAVGKYIITPDTLDILSRMKSGKSGEIRLADAFEIMLSRGKSIFGHILKGEWLDTGDKFNFVKATIHLALKHPDIGDKLRAYLKDLKI